MRKGDRGGSQGGRAAGAGRAGHRTNANVGRSQLRYVQLPKGADRGDRRGRARCEHLRGSRTDRVPRIESPRGAAHRGRSADRQHGPLCVPVAGSAQLDQLRELLDPVRGASGRPELLSLRRAHELRRQHRQQRGRASRHHLPVDLHDPLPIGRDLPLRHGSGHEPQRPEPEHLSDVRPDPDQERQQRRAHQQRESRAEQRRCRLDAELQRRSVRRGGHDHRGGCPFLGRTVRRRLLPRSAGLRPLVRRQLQ